MQETKICKQCKHWSYETSTSICKHELSMVTPVSMNIISGSVRKPVYRECGYMRFYSSCGEEGLLFEPKVSVFSNVINLFKVIK